MSDGSIDYDPSWLVALAREQQPELVVFLEDPVRGTLVLDVLRDGRVGGVELVARL